MSSITVEFWISKIKTESESTGLKKFRRIEVLNGENPVGNVADLKWRYLSDDDDEDSGKTIHEIHSLCSKCWISHYNWVADGFGYEMLCTVPNDDDEDNEFVIPIEESEERVPGDDDKRQTVEEQQA